MTGDAVWLRHILDAVAEIEQDTARGVEQALDDRLIQHAVVRNLEIIGEAVRHLSAEAKQAEPDIPWRRIAGMRDWLIHGYFKVDLEIVADAVANRLPELRRAVERLLADLER